MLEGMWASSKLLHATLQSESAKEYHVTIVTTLLYYKASH